MRRANRGFTLVELVVVVLIIGILAGFAIAQYNKVTEKGRMAEAFNDFNAIKSGQSRYQLKNNTFASASSDLDNAPPTTKYFGSLTITGTSTAYTIALTRVAPVNSNYGTYTVSYQGPQGTMSCSTNACANDLLP
jgi:prepilin-type N-terminal cleavage/methylation domain-containing protein